MDIWDKKKRSEVMSKIRSKNTKPEVILRKALFAEGYRYRINYKKLPGKPDIVLPVYRTAIFVHGCFWHGHEDCKIAHIPKTNSGFWKEKLARNKERDRLNNQEIKLLGWKVVTIWECEITKKTIPTIINMLTKIFNEESVDPSPMQIKVYEEISGDMVMVAEDIMPYKKKGKT